MPMLHRHIVPDVAGKADNGKIVVGANGKPSHRRLIEFSIDFGFDWAPAFASDAWWEARGVSSSFDSWVGSVDASVVAAKLNSPRSETGYNQGYYGDPPGGYSSGVAQYMSTGENFRVPAPAGSPAPFSWGMNLFGRLYLDWSSANAYWTWRFVVIVQGLWRYYNETNGHMDVITGADYLELTSAQLTTVIRPGANGIPLTPTTSPTGAFAGTNGATVYTAYA